MVKSINDAIFEILAVILGES